MDLNNKVIIVTGGVGLLGSEIVKNLRFNGAKAINADIVAENKDDFSEVHCDITNEESVKNLIDLVLRQYGRIDGLVNNAYPRTDDWGLKFEDIPFASWKANIDMQLSSVFCITQLVAAAMQKNQTGSIVNMASIYGVIGPDFSIYKNTNMTMPAAYSAIKGGLINFTKYLASYLGQYNIRVNCVSPGGILDQQPPDFVHNYEMKVPLRRMGVPNDIAPPVAFLLSDQSKYITGHNLIVDGGWTAI